MYHKKYAFEKFPKRSYGNLLFTVNAFNSGNVLSAHNLVSNRKAEISFRNEPSNVQNMIVTGHYLVVMTGHKLKVFDLENYLEEADSPDMPKELPEYEINYDTYKPLDISEEFAVFDACSAF